MIHKKVLCWWVYNSIAFLFYLDNVYPPDDLSLDPETHFENIYFILWMYPSNVIFLGDICIEWDEITPAMFWL